MAAVVCNRLVGDSAWAVDNVPRLAGALLVVAGAYQLTPAPEAALPDAGPHAVVVHAGLLEGRAPGRGQDGPRPRPVLPPSSPWPC